MIRPAPCRRVLALAFVCGVLAGVAGCSDAPPAYRSVSLEEMRAGADAATDDMAELLAETIRFASIEPEGPTLLPETEALLDRVLARGAEMGFSTRRAANGLVGILEYGRGEETVGVLIHLDVVPPGEASAWEHPPFAGVIADGVVHGRGAQDDKGALPSVLFGAKILIDAGMTFDRGLRIVLGTKEETSFEDVRTLFAEEAPPDYGIAPDGPFVVRGESGYLDVAYDFEGLGTAPASRDSAVYWDGGTVINSVPDLSFLVLRSLDVEATRSELDAVIDSVTEEFTRNGESPDLEVVDYASFVLERGLEGLPPGDLVLVSRGRTAHSSIPASGRNAVVEIALVGARLTELGDGAFRRAFRFVDEKLGLSTDGSGFGLEPRRPGLQGADTTASLDLVRTYPASDLLELAINFRVGVANTVAEIGDKSTATAAEYGAATRQLGTAFDAYYYPDDHPLLALVVESHRAVRGTAPLLIAVGATTYAKAAPNLVGYGPVDLAEDGLYFHLPNEQLPIAALTRNAVLYAHVLQAMIQAPESPVRAP